MAQGTSWAVAVTQASFPKFECARFAMIELKGGAEVVPRYASAWLRRAITAYDVAARRRRRAAAVVKVCASRMLIFGELFLQCVRALLFVGAAEP